MERLHTNRAESLPIETGLEQLFEQVTQAHELLATIKEKYEGEVIVGAAALAEVEDKAKELDAVLAAIPLELRRSEGLPFSPDEIMANDKQYLVTA